MSLMIMNPLAPARSNSELRTHTHTHRLWLDWLKRRLVVVVVVVIMGPIEEPSGPSSAIFISPPSFSAGYANTNTFNGRV